MAVHATLATTSTLDNTTLCSPEWKWSSTSPTWSQETLAADARIVRLLWHGNCGSVLCSFLKTQQIHLFYWYLFSKSLILSNLCKNINLIYFFKFNLLLLEIKSILKVCTNNFSGLLINLQNKKAILGSGGKSALNKSLRLEWIISIHLLAPERPTKYSN